MVIAQTVYIFTRRKKGMAKKIRFPLDMGNGVEVRTLEELHDNFCVDKVVGYYVDGKLITWLRDRYLDDLAEAVLKVDKQDSDLAQKICNIFGIDYVAETNIESIEERNRKLTLLKEYTVDEKYFDILDDIAFNQDEFYDLLDEGKNEVYLCGERFSIPLSKQNMKYIGVNNPIVIVNSKEIVDFAKLNIEFVDVKFDEAYQLLYNEFKATTDNEIIHSDLIDDFNNLKGTNLVSRIEKEILSETVLADKARYMLYQLYKYVPQEAKLISMNATEEIKKAASNGYEAARIRCSLDFNMYNAEYTEEGKSDVDKEAYRKYCCQNDYLERIDKEDCYTLYELGVAHLICDVSKAVDYIKKSAEMNCWLAERSMGIRYWNGDAVAEDVSMANEWYKKTADKGVACDCWQVAWNSLYNLKDDKETAYKYINLAYQNKDFIQQKFQEYKKGVELQNYPIYSVSLWSVGKITGMPYGTKSELMQKIDKVYSELRVVVKNVFKENEEFDQFCEKYISSYKMCLYEKLMMDYGEKNIETISANPNEYTYKEDIKKLLLSTLEQYEMDYLMDDISYDDVEWGSPQGSTGGLFSQPKYYINDDISKINHIKDEAFDRMKSYTKKAHDIMVDYFTKTLL